MSSVDPNQVVNTGLPTHIQELVDMVTSSERLRTHDAAYKALIDIGQAYPVSPASEMDWLVMPIVSKCYERGWLNSGKLADIFDLFSALGIVRGDAFNQLLAITASFFIAQKIEFEALTAVYKAFDRIPTSADAMNSEDVKCMLRMVVLCGDDYAKMLSRRFLMPVVVAQAPIMTADQLSSVAYSLINLDLSMTETIDAYHAMCRRIPEVVQDMTAAQLGYCADALNEANYRLPDERAAAHALLRHLPSLISRLSARQIRSVTKMMHNFNCRDHDIIAALGLRIIEIADHMDCGDIYWLLWAMSAFKIRNVDVANALAKQIPAVIDRLTNRERDKLITVLTELNIQSVEVRNAIGFLQWGIMYCPVSDDAASSSS